MPRILLVLLLFFAIGCQQPEPQKPKVISTRIIPPEVKDTLSERIQPSQDSISTDSLGRSSISIENDSVLSP